MPFTEKMSEIYLSHTKEIRIYSPVKTKLYVYTISGNIVDICMNDIEEGLNIVCCCNTGTFGAKIMIAMADSWIYELVKGNTLKPYEMSNFILSYFVQPKRCPKTLFYTALFAMDNDSFAWSGKRNFLAEIGYMATKVVFSGYDKHGEEIFFCTCKNLYK